MLEGDWFVDAFPAIVAMTCPVVEAAAPAAAVVISKQMISECAFSPSHLALLNLCEKYCQVNMCTYMSGTAVLLDVLLDLLPSESPRLPPLLVAVHEFRRKFLVRDHRGWLDKMRDAVAVRASVDATVLALVKFHRPGVDLSFVGSRLRKIVSTGFSCDSRQTERELLASIAATGEARMVPFLCVAIIDWSVSEGVLLNSDWTGEIDGKNLPLVWQTAKQIAALTPSEFTMGSCLGIEAGTVVRAVLKTTENFTEKPMTMSESICEDDEIRISCAAGTHVASLLPLFSLPELSVPPLETVVIDARSAAQRDKDATVVVTVNSSANEVDWYDDQGPRSPPSSVVILRLKRCLWVDEEIEIEDAFLTNLEFYRGNRLCLIEDGRNTDVRSVLLKKEFPYVCVINGGFDAIRTELVAQCDAKVLKSIAITTSPPSVAAPATPIVPRLSFLAPVAAKAPMVDFEIGSSEGDERDLRSVDLSPMSNM